ncbi:MAG: hypothetical protein CMH78_06810 [Nitrospinae bacterium]|jgi:16S rRNA (adenine1518-N6/adenine1519-N6)-dimethyltransferase|nr:hypothetical protein [Nitrospinota bacterium]
MMRIVKHKKRKKYGQHFLKDERVAEKIVSFADIRRNEIVLEIGPGKGVLTSILFKYARKVIAIEIDNELVRYLERRFSNEAQNLNLIHEDILKYDLSIISERIKVIGNLPYSIGTRIIMHLINYREKFSEMLFMLQKEVAERLVASPGTKDYGSLSIFIQLYFSVEILMNIPPKSFSPPPKVFSALVKIKPKKQLFKRSDNPELFYKIVKIAFSHRRKKLRNNLKALPLLDHDLKKVSLETGINFDVRGEMLSIKEYLKLTRSIGKIIKNHVSN